MPELLGDLSFRRVLEYALSLAMIGNHCTSLQSNFIGMQMEPTTLRAMFRMVSSTPSRPYQRWPTSASLCRHSCNPGTGAYQLTSALAHSERPIPIMSIIVRCECSGHNMGHCVLTDRHKGHGEGEVVDMCCVGLQCRMILMKYEKI